MNRSLVGPARGFALIGAAALGVALAWIVGIHTPPPHAFLASGSRLEVNGQASSRTSLYAYLVPGTPQETVQRLTAEIPHALIEPTDSGINVTVPRIENGRVQIAFPPEETLQLRPTKAGRFTEVGGLRYRQSYPLQGVLSFILRGLHI